MDLPTYIPLKQAARRYRVDVGILTRLAEEGKIRAAKTPEGEVMVADADVKAVARRAARREQLWERVKHLDGTPIGLEEACKKYNLSPTSVYNWIERGYVRVLEDRRTRGRGHKRLLNEADLAYAALVAAERGRRPGRRIFTPEYTPVHLTG